MKIARARKECTEAVFAGLYIARVDIQIGVQLMSRSTCGEAIPMTRPVLGGKEIVVIQRPKAFAVLSGRHADLRDHGAFVAEAGRQTVDDRNNLQRRR